MGIRAEGHSLVFTNCMNLGTELNSKRFSCTLHNKNDDGYFTRFHKIVDI